VLVHWNASANFSRHNKRGTGFIERIDTGWPLTPRPPRPQWPKPPKKIRDHFDEVSNFVIQSVNDVFYGGYLDYDKDHFRQLYRDHFDNLSLGNNSRISEFEPVLFESLLYWCDKAKHQFT
jgi:hypothetical protein